MKAIKTALLAGVLVLATGNTADWNNTVVGTGQGHRIGNPDARVQLTEYISYTCPHCAQFARDGDTMLKLTYVHDGRLTLEIRHLLRDPIDLTAALLTHCGNINRFTQNHNAIMLSQDKWLPTTQSATQAQIARWSNPDRAAARRAIASDFGFYELMEARGYGTAELDRCLGDETKAQALVEASRADTLRLGLRGTPSFVLDGELLEGVHGWDALKPAIDAKLAATPN